MVGHVGVVQDEVGPGDPYAIEQPQDKPMQKELSRRPTDDHPGAEDEVNQPEQGFDAWADPVYGGDGHHQAEEGERNKQFPVHVAGFPSRYKKKPSREGAADYEKPTTLTRAF